MFLKSASLPKSVRSFALSSFFFAPEARGLHYMRNRHNSGNARKRGYFWSRLGFSRDAPSFAVEEDLIMEMGVLISACRPVQSSFFFPVKDVKDQPKK